MYCYEISGFIGLEMESYAPNVFPRHITNFNAKDLNRYQAAISTYEQRYPEYAGVLIISDKPGDIVDIFGRTLGDWKQHRALMQTKVGPETLTEFWDIMWNRK